MVHTTLWITHRHRPQRIAVIAMLQRQQTVFMRLATRVLILNRHLDGHFHRDRPGVGDKHLVQPGRRQSHQPLSQLHRRGMSQSTKHHMTHVLQLFAGGGI